MSVVKSNPVKAVPFTKQLGFRKTVNERVEAFLNQNNLSARDVPSMYGKTIIVFLWYVGAYLLIMLGGFEWYINIALYVVYAMSVAGLGFNVMHDAIHGSYSRHPRINQILSFTMELIGSSNAQWRQKHNVWHHTYTNIAGLDEDLETNGLLRLSPHDAWKPRFRAQHLYLWPVYALTGFGFLTRDFRVYFTGKSDKYHVYPKMTRNEKLVFWAGKGVYFLINLVLPLFILPAWQALLGFVIVMLTVGVILASIFQLAHVMEPADFPEPTGDPLKIQNEWAIHQVNTTVNFAQHNRLLNWYAGGLNFQIEHHLFPQICHVLYPKIAPIVEMTCREFGVTYFSYPTWRQALMDHWKTVYKLGQKPPQMAMSA
jgi:linoleoyl-CoA desaturase